MLKQTPKWLSRASDWYNRRLRRWSTAVYALLLAVGSIVPSGGFPGILDWQELFSPDKVAHFGAYAVFTLLLSFSLPIEDRGKRIAIAMVIASAFGALMEVLQAISGTGREADPVDMLANLIGSLIGGLLSSLLYKLKEKYAAPAA